MVTIKINEQEIHTSEDATVLQAAQKAGIYIPRLCSHPDIPAIFSLKPAEFIFRSGHRIENARSDLVYEGCMLCVVKIEGKNGLVRACNTPVEEGMVIQSDTSEIKEFRRDRLMVILSKHPHACLTCAQKEGCARFPCSMNIPENCRCCSQFGNCELQRMAEYIGIKEETPRYVFEGLPVITHEPLFDRDYNLCIGCTRCIRICRDVRGIDAIDFVFDDEGRPIIGFVGPDSKKSGCRFCTACVEVCPTGALQDKEHLMKGRSREAALVPCKTTCPAEIDVPRYIRFIRQRNYSAAAALVREKAPFPRVLGYICGHPCETVCRRSEINQPISIRDLKRFAAEHDEEKLWEKKSARKPATGNKVAIIGSGPTGLTAAYYLTKKGHKVTVFESMPLAGGMMRYGIPEYRLPRDILDIEIKEIEQAGVEIQTNTPIRSLDHLLKRGYQAILVALGTLRGERLRIPGSNHKRVWIGIDFLKEINLGTRSNIGKRLVVLGGGNVALDCARVSRRIGADQVTVACLEPRNDMPAGCEEIEEAEKEGIVIRPSRTATRIVSENADISGVELLEVESLVFDQNKKPKIEVVDHSEHVIEADTVIFAIGQHPDIPKDFGVHSGTDNLISINPGSFETNKERIFAAGDAVHGTSSVIQAIASGRKAAQSMDIFLGGDGDISETFLDKEKGPTYIGRTEGFSDMPRRGIARAPIPPGEDVPATTTTTSLDEEGAIAEATRCLQCDLRLLISTPVRAPEKISWMEFTEDNVNDSVHDEAEGVVQLYDEQKNVIYIKGTMNLLNELQEQLRANENARYFSYEMEHFYSQKESELLQAYLAVHGQMPEGNRELDDLF